KVAAGPTAVIPIAALAGIGSLLFAIAAGARRVRRLSLVLTIVLGGFAAGNTALVNRQASLLPLRWVKGERAQPALIEKWNSFSRVWVAGDPSRPKTIF